MVPASTPSRSPRRRSSRRSIALLALVLLFAGCASSPYELGRRALDAGDPQAAEQYFQQAEQSGDHVFEAQRERGAARLELGDTAGALAQLEPLRAQRPDDERLLWLLGRAYGETQQHARAADAYRRYEQLTRDPSAKRAAGVRVAQLDRAVSTAAADSLLEARRSGVTPSPNTVAVVAFLPPPAGTPVDSALALRDASIRRALVSFVSADLAKVGRVRVIAQDMMDTIREELAVSYDNRAYFEDGSLVPQGGQQPAYNLVYGWFGGEQDAIDLGALRHAEATTAQVSDLEGDFARLMDLETDLVIDVLQSMDVEPTPEERLAIGEKPTRNLEAFIAFGEGLRLRESGRFEEASAAFARAARLDPGFRMAKQQQNVTNAMAAGPMPVVVPPPVTIDTASLAAAQATSSLGFGLAPDGSGEFTSGASTTDMTTVRGPASLQVSGRAGGGN